MPPNATALGVLPNDDALTELYIAGKEVWYYSAANTNKKGSRTVIGMDHTFPGPISCHPPSCPQLPSLIYPLASTQDNHLEVVYRALQLARQVDPSTGKQTGITVLTQGTANTVTEISLGPDGIWGIPCPLLYGTLLHVVV